MNKYLIIAFLISLNLNAYANGIYDFSDLQWSAGENEIEEAHVGDEIIIKFNSFNIPDDEIINIEIWEKSNGKLMDFIAELQGTVKNGIVEIPWAIELDIHDRYANYFEEIQKNGYTYIDYVFVIKYGSLALESKLLSIMEWVNQLVVDKNTKEPIKNMQYYIILRGTDEIIEGNTGDDGRIKLYRLKKVGDYRIIL
jgi:hypothetical protein